MGIRHIKKQLLLIISFFVLCAHNIVKPEILFASSNYVWHKSLGINSYSQDIRASSIDSNIIYATIRDSSGSALYKSINGGESFNLTFPYSTNRDVNSITLSHNDIQKLWIGTYQEGIFGTINGGGSWFTTSGILPKKTRYLIVDPTNDNNLFAGTGENNLNGGIYKSTDKGINWAQVGSTTFGFKNNLNIYIDTHNHNTIYAGSDFGLFKTTNGGNEWENIFSSNTNTPATLVSLKNESIIYASVPNQGVFKTLNGGANWILKNNTMGNSWIFRLAVDSNDTLYATRVNSGGGIWHSSDGAETWENVGDPSWGSRNTWGLDVSDNRILVSVEGLGIYYADLNPAPDPVVFIPGFLGSWSYKGLIENQSTTYADWELMPIFTDNYYQPLLSTLKNAGLTENQNLFTFGYDYRKSVVDSATSLNSFLSTKTSGQKANIVAHSMGGLVARYCFEKISGCADKIGKIITAGTPHKGLIMAYQLWEGGELDRDPLMKLIEEIALHSTNLPYLSNKDIIQNKFPGVKDLLPTPLISNPLLESLSNTPTITTLSGNSLATYESFSTSPRSAMDKALGLWIDGKPNVYSTGIGDGTVLKSSSNILGSDYSVEHKSYFRTLNSLTDIMNTLNLTPSSFETNANNVNYILAFIIHSPATITVNGKTGNAVFLQNPTSQNYEVTIKGTGNGNFQLDSIFTDSNRLVKNTITNTISLNQTKTFNFNFVPDSSQKFVNNQDNILLYSFNSLVAASKNRTVKSIAALVNKGVLEKSYIDLINLLKTENQALERKNIEDIANQLLVYVVDKNKTVISQSVALSEKGRALKSINAKLAKPSLITREAANLSLAQSMKSTADDLLNSGSYYHSILLYRGINYLLN